MVEHSITQLFWINATLKFTKNSATYPNFSFKLTRIYIYVYACIYWRRNHIIKRRNQFINQTIWRVNRKTDDKLLFMKFEIIVTTVSLRGNHVSRQKRCCM